jgi:hypothetical protein
MRKRVWLVTVLVCSLAVLSAGLAAPAGADFIAAWRKVITVFRGRGVTNADYLWIMTAFSFKAKDRRRAVDWYPGEADLDYIGADAYNWHNCRPGTSNPWNSLEQLVNPMRLFAQGKTIKGIMIPEWASTEDRPSPTARPSGSATPAPVRRLQPGVPGRLQGHGRRRLLRQGRTLSAV